MSLKGGALPESQRPRMSESQSEEPKEFEKPPGDWSEGESEDDDMTQEWGTNDTNKIKIQTSMNDFVFIKPKPKFVKNDESKTEAQRATEPGNLNDSRKRSRSSPELNLSEPKRQERPSLRHFSDNDSYNISSSVGSPISNDEVSELEQFSTSSLPSFRESTPVSASKSRQAKVKSNETPRSFRNIKTRGTLTSRGKTFEEKVTEIKVKELG